MKLNFLLKEFSKYSGNKIFCIGRNKTGTTSIKKAFELHGLKVGNQAKAELLIDAYAVRNFKKIGHYCKTAQAFQDLPFSLPYTYIYLDNQFPNSKFILTIRDSADVWYNSLINFHTKIFSKKNQLPTKDDLMNSPYRYKGFAWKVNRTLYNTPEEDIYNEKMLKQSYIRHNERVQTYFKNKHNLLIINLKEKNSYQQFCDFIEQSPRMDQFPHENKTL